MEKNYVTFKLDKCNKSPDLGIYLIEAINIYFYFN